MVRRASIDEFVEVDQPVLEAVTKFGGQPVWLQEPQWPLSDSTGQPMQFICQITLDPEIFGPLSGKMAYLFMTDDREEYVDGTWEPDGGENAVIIQPGRSSIPAARLEEGPTLYKLVQVSEGTRPEPVACEYLVRLKFTEDPNFVGEAERATWDEATWEEHAETLDGNKIGGTPFFIQGTEFPSKEPWSLLLQLDSTQTPFRINFGDAGVGYAFLSEDGQTGKFLWQCA